MTCSVNLKTTFFEPAALKSPAFLLHVEGISKALNAYMPSDVTQLVIEYMSGKEDRFGANEWTKGFLYKFIIEETGLLEEPELPTEVFNFLYAPDSEDPTTAFATHWPPVFVPKALPRRYKLHSSKFIYESIFEDSIAQILSKYEGGYKKEEPCWLVMRKADKNLIDLQENAGYEKEPTSRVIAAMAFALYVYKDSGTPFTKKLNQNDLFIRQFDHI